MNEQLQTKLIEIVSEIQSGVKTAGNFALEQLPDIAQQYVAYGRFSLTLYIVLAIVLVLLALFGVIKLCKWSALSYVEQPNEPVYAITIVGSGLAGILGVMVFCVNVSEFILVWTAPKVWLIKELAHLIK